MSTELCILIFLLVALAWGWILGGNVNRIKLSGWEGYREEE